MLESAPLLIGSFFLDPILFLTAGNGKFSQIWTLDDKSPGEAKNEIFFFAAVVSQYYHMLCSGFSPEKGRNIFKCW
jgi:hypothetical protein